MRTESPARAFRSTRSNTILNAPGIAKGADGALIADPEMEAQPDGDPGLRRQRFHDKSGESARRARPYARTSESNRDACSANAARRS